MKIKPFKFLTKPKVIIPIFVVLGVAVLAFTYKYVGQAPQVQTISDATINQIKPDGTIDLSFPKSGRVESISVKIGQLIHKGDILAKLSSPDIEGTVSQTKGALDLAEAQYSSYNAQYASTKKQQDLIVENAYQTLLSSGLEGTPSKQTANKPIISGTYTCGKEGSYILAPYASADSDTRYSFKYSGLEDGITSVKYENSIPLGECGLQIKWSVLDSLDNSIKWTVDIPNTKSSVYLTYKNAYELAKANREKVLSDLATTIGSGDSKISVAKAQVDAARGAYEAALGAYQNSFIIAPSDGVVTSIDQNLKVGQSVTATKPVISITTK